MTSLANINIFYCIGFACIIIMMLAFPLWGIVIGRHYDKLFPKYVADKLLFENQYWIASVCIRGLTYGGCIIFPKYTVKSPRKEILNYYFKGYSFRKNARWQDWLVINIEFGCIFGIIIFGFLGSHFGNVS